MFILQGKGASKLAGNWFELLKVLFTKKYLPISFLSKFHRDFSVRVEIGRQQPTFRMKNHTRFC